MTTVYQVPARMGGGGGDDGARGKQRRRWTEEEHRKLVEGLKLYGRDWKRIQAHVGTRNAAQLRSHAQKYFVKVLKEGSGEYIPPPQSRRTLINPNLILPEVFPRPDGTFVAAVGGVRRPTGADTPGGSPTNGSDGGGSSQTPSRPGELADLEPASPVSEKGGHASRPRTPLGELARDEQTAVASPRSSPLRPADIERAVALAARSSPLRMGSRWQAHVPAPSAVENTEHQPQAPSSSSGQCHSSAGALRTARSATHGTPLCLSYTHSGQAVRVVPIPTSVQTTSPLSAEAPSDFDSAPSQLVSTEAGAPASAPALGVLRSAPVAAKSSLSPDAGASTSSGGSNLHLLSLVADTIGRSR